jgi:ABC-type branched-subunit amino acid transport system substrate-binding protein
VTIGAVGEQTGPIGRFLADTPRAVAAWVAAVNARGGLHCHPLRYVVVDDGGDPARNQALTRMLVEQEGVVAFVANFAPIAGYASVRYLEEKRIPAVGTEGGSRWFYTSPMYFPQMTSGDGVPAYNFGALAGVARRIGLSKLASIGCIEVQSCAAFYDNAPKLAERFGLDLVYRGRASVVQPDFTSHCQAAKQAGAEMLIIGLDGNSVARLAKSCAAVNYKPVLSLPMSAGDNEMLKNPQLDRLVVAMPLLPFILSDRPPILEYQQTLKQFAPNLPISAATIAGWSAAKLFEAGTKDLAGLSSKEILEGMWAIKENDLGGLTHPLTFTKGQPAPQVLCFWQMQIQSGKFVSPDEGVRTCPAGWSSFEG